jgi:hypothetical protein
VPPGKFKEFPIQKIVDSNTGESIDFDWLEQYVLELDATPVANRFDGQIII